MRKSKLKKQERHEKDKKLDQNGRTKGQIRRNKVKKARKSSF